MPHLNLTHSKSLLMISMMLLIASCKNKLSNEQAELLAINTPTAEKKENHKIQVLNFGTFHFGATTDAHKTEFDEHSKKNQQEAHSIAAMLAAFQPTVILVETVPEYNEELQANYEAYLTNPDMNFEHPTETELLAFELGRLSGTNRIYGIDHKLRYNYRIGSEIENKVDPIWYDKFFQDPFSYCPEMNLINEGNSSLLDRLKLMNQQRFLDFAITGNADMLTHAGTENGFEGADEAAKYYQRNLRMYSNMNRIELKEDDRVFILMGASHTAFFRDFLSRSPKYEMVNTLDYLK